MSADSMAAAEHVALLEIEERARSIREWVDAFARHGEAVDDDERQRVIEGVSPNASAWLGSALDRVCVDLCGHRAVFHDESGAVAGTPAAPWDGVWALAALDYIRRTASAAGPVVGRSSVFLAAARGGVSP